MSLTPGGSINSHKRAHPSSSHGPPLTPTSGWSDRLQPPSRRCYRTGVSGSHEDLTIRRIRPDEGLVLRGLRLRSLTDSPAAFGQDLDEALARPANEWHRSALQSSRGQNRTWLLARLGKEPIGLVQGRRRPPSTLLLFSMWVAPGSRRQGVGERLISELEAWAQRWQATETVLWVLNRNHAALVFYQQLGFEVVESGTDAEAGARYDALAMRRAIDAQSS